MTGNGHIMEERILKAGGRRVAIYSHSDCSGCPVVYIHASVQIVKDVADRMGDLNVIFAVIDDVDWEHDLSPWPAPKAFRGGTDFSGGGDEYLSELADRIVPAAEEAMGFSPSCRILAGYSMAGLFAVYALYRTAIFDRVVSVSGSLWYDGFLDFMNKNRPVRLPERVYFSLGDREEMTKNRRLAAVGDCTAKAEERMRDLGVKTVFEMNEGNHFADPGERVAKGLSWILKNNGSRF